MENQSKILIIEDREPFREIAKQYFNSQGIDVTFAGDYNETMERLNSNYDGTFIDVFFPKQMGSGDRKLGMNLIERIYTEVRDCLEDPDSDISVQAFSTIEEYRLPKAREERYEILDLIRKIKRKFGNNKQAVLQFYREVMQGNLEKDESNQPLGILVAEEVDGKMPFCLVTSTGHHGIQTDLVCQYQRLKKWPEMVDGYKEPKDSIEFWKIAHRLLHLEDE